MTCQLGCDGWAWGDDSSRAPADGTPFTLRVVRVSECSPSSSASAAETTGAARRRLLGVEVELTSWEPTGLPANYYYASVVDGAGRRYPSVDLCGSPLSARPLGVGETAQGLLAFSVPLTATHLKLVYAPRLLESARGAEKARVEVTLDAQN